MTTLSAETFPGRDVLDLYRRTYMTMLRSSAETRVRTLVPAHRATQSSLHAAASERLDAGAFMYAANRLPVCLHQVEHIWLGQLPEQVAQATGCAVDGWPRVRAAARRRHWHFDGAHTLAAYIASPSDLDDLIPTLVAYQIEWNKLHEQLCRQPDLRQALLEHPDPRADVVLRIGQVLDVPDGDWERLLGAWGAAAGVTLGHIARAPKDLRIRLIGGTHVAYAKLIRRWSEPILRLLAAKHLERRPVYFVSSNLHALTNLLSGYARWRAPRLEAFLRSTEDMEAATVRAAWQGANRDNLLYYAARLWARQQPDAAGTLRERLLEAERCGIWHVPGQAGCDVDVQIIDLHAIDAEQVDPRLRDVMPTLVRSDAIIINIDYPLGLAAYRILRELAEAVERLVGVYIVGKAATLSAEVGDILISDVVYDQHSANTYAFPNAFRSADLAPYMTHRSVLDNQKAVTVRGTFLQNHEMLDGFYREQYTVVEMEAGPYLAAVYEATYPTRHPVGEAIHMRAVPFDVGMIHYASDTPYTRTRTLGGRGLSLDGVEATYAALIAVVRRIAVVEASRGQRQKGDGGGPRHSYAAAAAGLGD